MEIPRVYLVLCFCIASLLLQKVGRLSAKGTLRRDRCIISRFRFFREIIGYNNGMEGNNKPMPKQALTQPSWLAVFGLIILCWFNTRELASTLQDSADALGLFVLILLPMTIMCSCFTGLAVAKVCWSKGWSLASALLIMIISDAVMILLFILMGQITDTKACFDACVSINKQNFLIASVLAPTIILSFGCFAAYRYYVWVKKYNLPRPVIKFWKDE